MLLAQFEAIQKRRIPVKDRMSSRCHLQDTYKIACEMIENLFNPERVVVVRQLTAEQMGENASI